jgi:hypothetical protein
VWDDGLVDTETNKEVNTGAQPNEAAPKVSGKQTQIVAFVLITLIAAGLFVWMQRQEVADPMQPQEEEVSEEVRALRAGEGALPDEEFSSAFCEGTFTHVPVGYSFNCPEG